MTNKRQQSSLGLYHFPNIDPGTQSRIESFPPGQLFIETCSARGDEITPIADYIAAEMNTNAHGAAARTMAELNGFSATGCVTDYLKLPLWQRVFGIGITPQQCNEIALSNAIAALLAWTLKVHQNGEWDHKPKIAARFHPGAPPLGPQHWHHYQATLYYYEVWSNIHYGYVGKAAGFSNAILLDGAGLEQIASTLHRLKWPGKSPDTSGLRAWDDPHDRASIMMGIQLYAKKPTRVTGNEIRELVVANANAILSKPYKR